MSTGSFLFPFVFNVATIVDCLVELVSAQLVSASFCCEIGKFLRQAILETHQKK